MIGNKDFCKHAAIKAAEEAKKNLLGKKPILAVIFESMARLKLLGRAAGDEIRARLDHLRRPKRRNRPIIARDLPR